jgi:hypothetical protein
LDRAKIGELAGKLTIMLDTHNLASYPPDLYLRFVMLGIGRRKQSSRGGKLGVRSVRAWVSAPVKGGSHCAKCGADCLLPRFSLSASTIELT